MRQNGFTLIEALVAAAVIGLAFTALLGFFPSLNQINRGTQEDQAMTLAAKAFMEELREAWSEQSYFDDGTLTDRTALQGYTLPDTANMTCTVALSDPDAGAFTPVQRKRVALTCALASASQVFAIEFGRPE